MVLYPGYTRYRIVSERRVELEMLQAVDRFDFDPAHRIVLHYIERDGRAGSALRPELLVEVGQVRGRFAVDADNDVAALDAGFFRRGTWRHAVDDQAATPFVGGE